MRLVGSFVVHSFLVNSLLAVGLLTTPADASDLRSVVADPYGNAIIITRGGAKIIAVGQAALADTFVPEDVAVTEEVAVAKGKYCREVGIVLKGRSFMYGVSDGDPVPLATKIICD
jgi:hypothetical protein